jgi:hypothetical protein
MPLKKMRGGTYTYLPKRYWNTHTTKQAKPTPIGERFACNTCCVKNFQFSFARITALRYIIF